jgi:hypothetical protein
MRAALTAAPAPVSDLAAGGVDDAHFRGCRSHAMRVSAIHRSSMAPIGVHAPLVLTTAPTLARPVTGAPDMQLGQTVRT